MKTKPIRHSAIYTSASSGCLRILRTDATIYVTPEEEPASDEMPSSQKADLGRPS